ncbi:MAG: hypothetical protein NTY84_14010 [Verrucomicrobia bacterium]|nr:hypothetical protein [Verrucomicrobiota bacterium]
MDITKEIERQAQELQKKLELLRDNNLQELVTKKAALETQLTDIEAQISNTCKRLGISMVGSSSPARAERRTRMGGDVIRAKITEVLKASPQGLSQIDIAKQTGVSYASVINFLKDNQDSIRTEGDRKSKLVFLK